MTDALPQVKEVDKVIGVALRSSAKTIHFLRHAEGEIMCLRGKIHPQVYTLQFTIHQVHVYVFSISIPMPGLSWLFVQHQDDPVAMPPLRRPSNERH